VFELGPSGASVVEMVEGLDIDELQAMTKLKLTADKTTN
jgi:acyl CoA:acetate/3-ketoacid CoA transferase beta subunit